MAHSGDCLRARSLARSRVIFPFTAARAESLFQFSPCAASFIHVRLSYGFFLFLFPAHFSRAAVLF